MKAHKFNTQIKYSLDSVICFKTRKKIPPVLFVQIEFRNYYEEDFYSWDLSTHGELEIIKIFDLNSQKELDYESQTIIARLDIRVSCFDFLRKNNLQRYSNIIPLQSIPYKMHNPFIQNSSQLAVIHQFPNKE